MCRDSKCHSNKSSQFKIKHKFKYSTLNNNLDSDTFAYKLSNIRQSKKITKKQLGESIGVKPRMITMYEAGLSYPKIESISLMANILEVEPDALYDEVIWFQLNIKNEMQILRNKMSFSEIATKIDSNHRTVRDWHKGKHLPNATIVKNLIQLKNKLQI